MTWQEISNDPNSLKLIDLRKGAVKAALKPPVTDRLAYLTSLASGKEVLDIGVVDHMVTQHHSPDWLQGALKKAASKILGVDILAEAVNSLKAEGYNVILHDITVSPLSEKFDLIVAGEVIEHLGNPGAFFSSAAKMLKPGGSLVLTTPNPYYVARVRDNLRYGFGSDSVDHVIFPFPFGVAELCERAGLRLASWRGIRAHKPKSFKGKIIMFLTSLLPLSPESLCDAVIYECVLK
jgi:cyclopropane fatty-acyl-phospholipid synthase-like methyltransferase